MFFRPTRTGTCPPPLVGNARGPAGCRNLTASCADANGGCARHSVCADSPAGPQCGECVAGYSGSGSTICLDVDACGALPPQLNSTTPCAPNVVCSDVLGDSSGKVFTCGECPLGRAGNGTVCYSCTPIVSILGTSSGGERARVARNSVYSGNASGWLALLRPDVLQLPSPPPQAPVTLPARCWRRRRSSRSRSCLLHPPCRPRKRRHRSARFREGAARCLWTGFHSRGGEWLRLQPVPGLLLLVVGSVVRRRERHPLTGEPGASANARISRSTARHVRFFSSMACRALSSYARRPLPPERSSPHCELHPCAPLPLPRRSRARYTSPAARSPLPRRADSPSPPAMRGRWSPKDAPQTTSTSSP